MWGSQSSLLCSLALPGHWEGNVALSSHAPWEITHLHSCEHVWVLNPHKDLAVLFCGSSWLKDWVARQPCTAGSCSLDSFTQQNRKSVETTDYIGYIGSPWCSIHAEDMPEALAHTEGNDPHPKLMAASNRPTPLIWQSEMHEQTKKLSHISWISLSAPIIPSPPHPAWRSPSHVDGSAPRADLPLHMQTCHPHSSNLTSPYLGLQAGTPTDTLVQLFLHFCHLYSVVLISISSCLSSAHIISCFKMLQNRK